MRNLFFFTFLLGTVISNLHAQQDTIGYKLAILPSGDTLDAAAAESLDVFEDLFVREEPLKMTLYTDERQLKKNRRKEEYQPATMTCLMHDSIRVTHPVRIKARGNFRKDYCTLPPFWLNFRYAAIDNPELEDIRRMKMVIRCRPSRQFDEYVLREYLTYKIYNLFTDFSFRVRLIDMALVDAGERNEMDTIFHDWAFLIEPEELVAKRLGGLENKSDRLAMRMIHQETMDLMAMFHYMIGHGDYSVTGRHNLKIFNVSNDDVAGFVTVPYDFDYTGLVDAHYAVPGEALGIRTVRERYFLGPCRRPDLFRITIDTMFEYRDEIEELIGNFEYLDGDEKSDMIEYLSTFYRAAESENFIDRQIISTCRSINLP